MGSRTPEITLDTVRRSQNVKGYIVSKSVDSIRKQPPKKLMMLRYIYLVNPTFLCYDFIVIKIYPCYFVNYAFLVMKTL